MLVVQKTNKIPKKLHHYPEYYMIKKRDPDYPIRGHCPSGLKDRLVVKYSPKYYRSFEPETWNEARRTRVLKRMKKISYIYERMETFSSKNFWRTIFQNKFKCVDAYCHSVFPTEQTIQRYRAFSKITKILLFDEFEPSRRRRSRKIKKPRSLAQKLLRYLPGMANLKFLSLEIRSAKDLYLLKMLNPFIHTLPLLKTFRIECSWRKSWEGVTILPSLFKNPNVLKYVTHLSLGRIAGENSYELFKLLPEHCRDLAYLSFVVCANRSFNLKTLSDPYGHAGYLQVLQDFYQLEGIRIAVEDTLAFMENFTAPFASLEFLSITFLDPSWHDICQELFAMTLQEFKEDRHKDLQFLQNERTKRFAEKFFALENLQSLQLSAQDAPEAVGFILPFFNCLLLGVPLSTLQNFEFSLLHFGPNDSLSLESSFISLEDFFVFREHSVFHSLKTLKLSLPRCYYVSDWEVKNNNFSQLSSFEFSGFAFPAGATLKSFFNIAKKDASSNDVNTFFFKIFLYSTELLDLLKTIKSPPRNSQIKLLIFLSPCAELKLIEAFAQKQKNLPKIQNVAIHFVIFYGAYACRNSLLSLSQVFGEVSVSSEFESALFFFPKEDNGKDNEPEESIEKSIQEEKLSQSEYSDYSLHFEEGEGDNGTEYQVSEGGEAQKADFEDDEKEISLDENQFSEEEK